MRNVRLAPSLFAAAALLLPAVVQAGTKVSEAQLKELTVDADGSPVEDILEVLDIKTEAGVIHWIATVKEGQYSCSIKEAELKKPDAAACEYYKDSDGTYI